MTDGAIVVLDAGSSGPRCLVYDGDGRTAGLVAGAWRYAERPDAPYPAREFDAADTWADLCALVRSALSDAGASNVAAVAVTGQRQAVVFLDAAGRELYAGPNTDARAVFEGGALELQYPAEMYAATGRLPSLLSAHAKLLWFRNNQPRAFAAIARVLTLPAWIAWKLTGEPAEEPALATEAGLLDVRRGDWHAPPFADADVDPGGVRLVPPGEFAGEVQADAASEAGLPQGAPVCLAGPDTQCGLLGMGVADVGEAGVVAGWSVPVQMVTGPPTMPEGLTLPDDLCTWTGLYLQAGKWIVESNAGDLGNVQRWLAELLFGNSEEGLAAMNALAESVSPGADGVTAVLGPPRMRLRRMGIRQGGILFPVPMVFGEVGRGHLIRAQMESAAFAIRANLEQVEDAADSRASVVRLGGGMARMPIFAEIVGQVLGRQIDVSAIGNVSAFGAHLSAAVALGRFPHLSAAAEQARNHLYTLIPDPLDASGYDYAYEDWQEVAEAMEDLMI